MKTGRVPPSVLTAMFVAVGSLVFAQQSDSPPTQGAQSVQTGTSPHLFQTVPGWAKIPATAVFGPTHGGVAVDSAGNVYVSTDGPGGIFVFARDGTFLRTMAPKFSGTHSLVINKEGGVDYLYGVHLRQSRAFKMSLDGNPIVIFPFPKEAGIYAAGVNKYEPAGIAVAPDLSVFISDGYGSNYIHKYSPQGQYVGSFGGAGGENGKFKGCLGLALDTRQNPPLLLVCDCNNNRLQAFDLNGNFVRIVAQNLARPASVAVFGQTLAIAEHEGRVTLLDSAGGTAISLGENPDQTQWGNFRLAASTWTEGVFVAPHGIAWDAATGSLYIQEWSLTGRLEKLDPAP